MDALTVNGYLGSDGINLLKTCENEGKGIFVLVKTSNPSSGELQDLNLRMDVLSMKPWLIWSMNGAEPIGECGYSSVGAVVGATILKQSPQEKECLKADLVPG